MEIVTHPQRSDQRQAGKRLTAFVRFDNSEERRCFGAHAPKLSKEHMRLLAHIFGLSDYECRGEFPQTREIPYSVIGVVATNLTLEAAPSPEVRNTESTVLSVITDHLEQQREAALVNAEQTWTEIETDRLEHQKATS